MVKSRNTISERIFESLFGNIDFEHVTYSTPLDYISQYWTAYKTKHGTEKASINGNIFEFIIYTLLYRENILPFYTQAKVAFVPNIEYDTILYTDAYPICLSLKTSLRERYKQADLEAIALVNVHRRAKSYLLTLESDEAQNCKEKILSGDIIGLNKIIDCNTEDINILIEELKEYKDRIKLSKEVKIIEGNIIV